VRIEPRNVTAQLHHRAAGNPPSTLPESAVSNCFPGLEFDFRNVWRRVFEGIEVHEAHGFVVRTEDRFEDLRSWYLVQVAGVPTRGRLHGPTETSPDGDRDFVFMEWSNALAEVLWAHAGKSVNCDFAQARNSTEGLRTVELRIRPIFVRSQVTGDVVPLVDEVMAAPGELTQSLCSPWQSDYRECGCYYWAASRPDYVNVEATPQGPSTGNNWMAKTREPKRYEPDNLFDRRQIGYEDLYRDWQGLLRFIVEGRDHD